eukprot:TRINITY_DN4706_c0_g3_i2.p1 TRINITY_DN4706_c0_g3~~TRINITY_DN4706_c0_g3_i2.p1  ORF type:complete len:725 (-),score=146.84 TRINITY_DN4706_c0_g3_i2:411-2489(-)
MSACEHTRLMRFDDYYRLKFGGKNALLKSVTNTALFAKYPRRNVPGVVPVTLTITGCEVEYTLPQTFEYLSARSYVDHLKSNSNTEDHDDVDDDDDNDGGGGGASKRPRYSHEQRSNTTTGSASSSYLSEGPNNGDGGGDNGGLSLSQVYSIYGQTPVHLAVGVGSEEIRKQLEKDPRVDYVDNFGQTALYYAVCRANKDLSDRDSLMIIRELIRAGADAEAPALSSDITILDCACDEVKVLMYHWSRTRLPAAAATEGVPHPNDSVFVEKYITFLGKLQQNRSSIVFPTAGIISSIALPSSSSSSSTTINNTACTTTSAMDINHQAPLEYIDLITPIPSPSLPPTISHTIDLTNDDSDDDDKHDVAHDDDSYDKDDDSDDDCQLISIHPAPSTHSSHHHHHVHHDSSTTLAPAPAPPGTPTSPTVGVSTATAGSPGSPLPSSLLSKFNLHHQPTSPTPTISSTNTTNPPTPPSFTSTLPTSPSSLSPSSSSSLSSSSSSSLSAQKLWTLAEATSKLRECTSLCAQQQAGGGARSGSGSGAGSPPTTKANPQTSSYHDTIQTRRQVDLVDSAHEVLAKIANKLQHSYFEEALIGPDFTGKSFFFNQTAKSDMRTTSFYRSVQVTESATLSEEEKALWYMFFPATSRADPKMVTCTHLPMKRVWGEYVKLEAVGFTAEEADSIQAHGSYNKIS